MKFLGLLFALVGFLVYSLILFCVGFIYGADSNDKVRDDYK